MQGAQGPCTTAIAGAVGSAAIRIFFAGCPPSDGPPSTIPIPRVVPFIAPNCTEGEERDDVEPDGPGVIAARPRARLVLGSFT